jgi:uncharacterized membrane protein
MAHALWRGLRQVERQLDGVLGVGQRAGLARAVRWPTVWDSSVTAAGLGLAVGPLTAALVSVRPRCVRMLTSACSSLARRGTRHIPTPTGHRRGGTMNEIRIPGLGKPFDPPRASERRKLPEDRLAEFLGWFSLGLGVPQLLAPGLVNRLIGVRDDGRSRLWQRVVGMRELLAAAGIFSQRRPVPWLWSRVAGDVKDLALLGSGLGKSERPPRTVAAMGSVAGILGADVLAAIRNMRQAQAEGMDPRRVRAAITVRASGQDVYNLWRDFENLPGFMAHLESVQVTGGRSHWKAMGPAGRTVEWDAEITEDRPGELIAWRSLPGAGVPNSGTVTFATAPGNRGTEVRVELRYDPPGGVVGATVAKLMGEEPHIQAKDDLRRFKQMVETGIVVRSEGSPEGPLARRMLRQRPAQPLPEPARAN